jgi:hypothetical protein
MVNQPFKPKHGKKTKRKLKSGQIVSVRNQKGTKVKIALSYVKKPGPGMCLRGRIQTGKHKGKKMSFGRHHVV